MKEQTTSMSNKKEICKTMKMREPKIEGTNYKRSLPSSSI